MGEFASGFLKVMTTYIGIGLGFMVGGLILGLVMAYLLRLPKILRIAILIIGVFVVPLIYTTDLVTSVLVRFVIIGIVLGLVFGKGKKINKPKIVEVKEDTENEDYDEYAAS